MGAATQLLFRSRVDLVSTRTGYTKTFTYGVECIAGPAKQDNVRLTFC